MQIIAGNCVLEDLETAEKTALFLKQMSNKYKFDLIYKSSWKKDNRSSLDSWCGPGILAACDIFSKIRKKYQVKILTDFHHVDELRTDLLDVVDIIQLPAYLCMQTDLTVAMAQTGKPINIKKGQFLHPEDIDHVVKKIEKVGNDNIMITERGTCFGYRDLVVDPRSIFILKQMGYPVFVDIGHAVRKYGIPSRDWKRGGAKQYIPTLGRVALALKCNLFVEVHPDPHNAKCDAATQLSFDEFELLMEELCDLI